MNSMQNLQNSSAPLRQGKWTREEEEYVHCLIDEFKTGMMPLAEGTSLRTFLSKMLNCHPMRISKKFVGSNYNGKQVYSRRTGSDRLSNDEVKARRAKLCDLERKFLAKIAPNKPKPKPQHQPPLQAQRPQLPSASGLVASINGVSTSGVDLRNLLNQAALQQEGGGKNADMSRNISLLDMPLNDTGNSSSSHSLQNLFQELVGSGSTGSLQAFNMMMQHQQQDASNPGGGSNHFSNSKSNSRAAAAGRALLQSGLNLDKKPSSASPGVAKPLASFTSAELAAELRKRSSLQDLVAQLGGGGGGQSSSAPNSNSIQGGNNYGQSLASLQDSLQQAAEATNANALGSLIRNSSIDMSGVLERQGSIDSLSNLAIRSRLQSVQSLGSLLDPLLDGGNLGGSGGRNNHNWTAKNAAAANGLNLNNLAAKVSTENLSGSQARDLMDSLGVGRAGLSNLGRTSSSGLNLASLLNNEDALRRLEASAPSSLNSNFSFQQQQESKKSDSGRRSSADEENTAIAQFLLQKKLLEQGKDNGGAGGNSEQQQLMMNVAAGSGGGGRGMDPLMSSLLSSLRPESTGSNSQRAQQQESDFDALKRKFLGHGGSDGLMEQRRNKPFR